MFVVLQTTTIKTNKNEKMKFNKNIIIPLLLLPIWYFIYTNLQPMTDWLIDSTLGLTKGAHLTETLRFFIF